MKREVVKAYVSGLSRFLVLWLGAVLLGLRVLLLRGFTTNDIWHFLLAHKHFAALFTALPFVFIVLLVISEITGRFRLFFILAA